MGRTWPSNNIQEVTRLSWKTKKGTTWKRQIWHLLHLYWNHFPSLSPGQRGTPPKQNEASMISFTQNFIQRACWHEKVQNSEWCHKNLITTQQLKCQCQMNSVAFQQRKEKEQENFWTKVTTRTRVTLKKPIVKIQQLSAVWWRQENIHHLQHGDHSFPATGKKTLPKACLLSTVGNPHLCNRASLRSHLPGPDNILRPIGAHKFPQ